MHPETKKVAQHLQEFDMAVPRARRVRRDALRDVTPKVMRKMKADSLAQLVTMAARLRPTAAPPA